MENASASSQPIRDAREKARLEAPPCSALSFRAILEGVPTGIIAADAETRCFVFANDSICKMLGYEQEEVLRLTLEDIHPPDALPRTLKKFEKIMSGEVLFVGDLPVIRKDGSVFPVDIECSILDLGGRPCVLGAFTDLTEQKRAEDALRESEVRTRTILQAIPDLMFIHDRKGRYLDYHTADTRLLAFEPEELLQRNIRDVFSNEMTETIFEKFDRAHETGETQVIDYSLDLPVGRRHFEARINRMDADRQLTIVRDVTERKRAEEAQRRVRTLESLGTVAGGIAHDFNNLLMGVFGNIEIAQRDLPNDHPALSSLQFAHQALENARQLTSRLLTFARGGNPVMERVDLRQRIYDTVRFNLAGSNVATRFDMPEDLWPAKADKGQIVEVISNLTVNAKEAMPSGGTLHVHAQNVSDIQETDAPALRGDYVKLTFKDEGKGIPPRVIRRVFDPYFTTKQTGTGLGLAIVHGIVSRHQGHVGIESAPDVGTTFTVFLPAEKAAGTHQERAQPDRAPTPGSARILLMDDDEMILNVTSQMIEQLGHAVETASNGREAIDKYAEALNSKAPFDLTIMDLTVPGGMGGKKAIGELLAIDPSAKVIVASGYSSDPVLADYGKHGFLGCLAKPFDSEELGDTISRALKISAGGFDQRQSD